MYGRNPDIFGAHEISSNAVVIRGSTPGAYKTVLYNRSTLQPIANIISNPDGSYTFTHLKNDSSLFFVVAFDNFGGTANMGASDALVLTVMVVPDF